MTRRKGHPRGRRGAVATAATAAGVAAVGVLALALSGLVPAVSGEPAGPVARGAPSSSASAGSTASAGGPGGAGDGRHAEQDSGESGATASPLPRAAPTGLRIPAVGLSTDRVVRLGLTEDRRLEVPDSPQAVGWYVNGPTPGEVGPAIVAGHVDSDAGPAVFYHLSELARGDTITVRRDGGSTATFTVYATESHRKDEFPTDKVYGETGGRAELRLITCGGEFNERTQHYRRNIIVYARLTGTSAG